MATTALIYASAISAILAVVLAVARDVPILHLLIPPEHENAVLDGLPWLALLVLFVMGCGLVDGIVGPKRLTATWLGGLVYFWWMVVWHLRERR